MSTQRAKTTAASTAGSFAAHAHTESEVSLTGAAEPWRAAWDALPDDHPWKSDEERFAAIAQNINDSYLASGDLASRVADTAKLAAEHGVEPHVAGDAGWPSGLRRLGTDEPSVLWARGDFSLVETPDSVVNFSGSRAASAYGLETTRVLADEVTSSDQTVLSSGGYGIAAMALRGSLAAGGNPVVVSACGGDKDYPMGNKQLLQRVSSTGGLVVSEVPPGINPTRYRFMRANALSSALSGKLVVVETAKRGGAMLQAEEAIERGIPVGVVPGPVTSETSAGSNTLLVGRARPITSGEDIERLGND